MNLLIKNVILFLLGFCTYITYKVIRFKIIKSSTSPNGLKPTQTFSVIKVLNFKLFGNIFNLREQLSLKDFLLILFASLLEPIIELLLEIKCFQDFTFQDIASGLAISVLALCFYSFIKDYKIIAYFLKKYLLTTKIMKFYLMYEAFFAILLYYWFRNFPIYGFTGAFLWFFSGTLRIIIQTSKSLFKENSLELSIFIQNFSYLRTSFYFLYIIFFINKLQIIIAMKNFVYNPNNIAIDDFLRIAILFLISVSFMFYCIFNLYPYLNNRPEVQKSIEFIQFISSSKKGHSFEKIHKNFKGLDPEIINLYLSRLTYVDFIQKDGKYKLTDHYYKILCGSYD